MKKYKTLNSTYPMPLSSFPDEVKFVGLEEFFDKSTPEIPLIVGTQIGFYPQDFNDLKVFKGREIAILTKSVLSNVPYGPKVYLMDEETMDYLKRSFGYYVMN